MIQPIRVEPRPGYRVWIQFSDGVAGEVDLSGLVGRSVFQAWNTPGYFEKVYITPHRAIAWDDDIELCADALYLGFRRSLDSRFRGNDPLGQTS